MPKRTSKRKSKQDRYAKQKMAAIPLLLAVLGFVLWSNMGGSESTTPVASSAASQTSPTAATSTSSTPANSNSIASGKSISFTEIEWPEPVLSFLDADSPFKDLDYTPEPAKLVTTPTPSTSMIQQQQSQLALVAERVKRERVPFSFRSSRRNVVMLGDKLIQVGDEIDDNVRVSSISDGSLELAVVAARPESETRENAATENGSAVN